MQKKMDQKNLCWKFARCIPLSAPLRGVWSYFLRRGSKISIRIFVNKNVFRIIRYESNFSNVTKTFYDMNKNIKLLVKKFICRYSSSIMRRVCHPSIIHASTLGWQNDMNNPQRKEGEFPQIQRLWPFRHTLNCFDKYCAALGCVCVLVMDRLCVFRKPRLRFLLRLWYF